MFKEFDKVCHNKFLLKISNYGISVNVFKWIKSYLHIRSKRDKDNSTLSPFSMISSAVQHGLVRPWSTLIPYFV